MEDLSKNVPQKNVNIDPTTLVSPHDTNISPAPQNPEDLDSQWLRWKCLVCGYVYEGTVPLNVCPKCGNEDPDKFDDAE